MGLVALLHVYSWCSKCSLVLMSCTHETLTGAEQPWKMTDSAPDYIDRMLTAIVGIEIGIDRIAGKWKLSQNREDRDRVHAAEELRKRGEHSLSAAMLKAVPGKQ